MCTFTAVTAFIGFGSQFNKPYIYKFPTSIENCPFNQSMINGSMYLYNNASGELPYSLASNFSTTWQPLTSTKSVEELIAERLVSVLYHTGFHSSDASNSSDSLDSFDSFNSFDSLDSFNSFNSSDSSDSLD